MKIKSFLARPFASYIYKQIRRGMNSAVEDQKRILKELVKTGRDVEFGNDHHFKDIEGHFAQY